MFKHSINILLFLALFSIIYSHTHAQTLNNDSLMAANYFDNEDYNRALNAYLKLFRKNKEDVTVNYRIGYCYLHLNDDKSRAIPFFEYVFNKGDYKDDLLLYMGKAYMYAYNFEDALTFFNQYRKIIYSKKFELIENYYEDAMEGKIDYQKKITIGNFGVVDHCIENSENAIEMVKRPLNVTFENLGKDINSPYADYYPFVTKDHGTLYFTSRRGKDTDSLQKWQAEFSSDIYYSTVKDGQWNRATTIGSVINTAEDEECVYVTPDGKNMIVYEENENATGDLSIVSIENMATKPVSFNGPINTQFHEYEGCIAEDSSIVIFSSDREGGLGETDLYIVRKLGNGKWSVPYNLGAGINTKYKEAFPMFDEKNNVLYFASEGHLNMGGYDIFSSSYDLENQKFGDARNVGYPINTPTDDMQFSMAENGREGYISAVRKDGLGDLDIYKIVFNDIEKPYSVIRGVVSIKDGDTLRKDIIASVSLQSVTTNTELDSKDVNRQTGRYIFAVDNPGKYILKVKSPDLKDVEQEINVYDKSDFVFEIEKDFLLQKDNPDSLSSNNTPSKDSVETISIQKLPVNIILWGHIKTNDTSTSTIDAVISLTDAITNQEVARKNANPQNGKYSFSVKTGKYTMYVNSPGYENFKEEINTDNLSDFFETGKNVTLKKNTSVTSIGAESLKTSADVNIRKTTHDSSAITRTEKQSVDTTAKAGTAVKKITVVDPKTTKTIKTQTSTTKKKTSTAVKKQTTSTKKQINTKKKTKTAVKKQTTATKKQTGTKKKTNTAVKKQTNSGSKKQTTPVKKKTSANVTTKDNVKKSTTPSQKNPAKTKTGTKFE